MTALTRRQVLVGGGVVTAGAVAAMRHPWTKLGPGGAAASPNPLAGIGTLVLVTLYGGNDGLNTVIPTAGSQYLALRPNLGYPAGQVIPLADGMALHPNLKGLKGLWDSQQLAIVRGVGYPNPVLSHFSSMDIWQTASPGEPVTTGWLGRWLDTGSDPMRALSIGPTLPLLLRGERESGTAINAAAITARAASALSPAVAALEAPGPDRTGLAARVARSGSDLLLVEHTLSDLLRPATANTPVLGKPPSGGAAGALAAQLDLVARLIRAGSPTRVYHVSLGGFDNHATEKATHAHLMTELDQGISGFMASVKDHPLGAGVVLMTYSEFGRRPAENASGGTDHGTASSLFVAGPGVKGGRFYGEEPSLTDLDQGNLKFTTDFRSVYATVLGKVLHIDPKVALGGNSPTLPFL
jgi:uncharacterized protein (DUF1501 family)